ncbi:MAG: hypothetical protein RIK85_08300 [Marinobacter sp.]
MPHRLEPAQAFWREMSAVNTSFIVMIAALQEAPGITPVFTH